MENKTPNEQKEQKNTPKSRAKKKIWYGVAAVGIAAISFFSGFGVRWFTIEPEMRTLIDVKNKIDEEYYKDVSDEEFYGTVFDAVNRGVLDAYSHYMNKEEFAESTSDMKGNRSGVGLVFLTSNEKGEAQMLVTRVCGNSPAEAAGITAGSYVVGFGKTQDEIQKSVVFNEFFTFLQQFEAGQTFYVRIVENGEERTVPLHKSAYVENLVFYRTNELSYTLTGETAESVKTAGKPLAALDKDTAYIRLVQFSGNAAKEFKGAMERFRADGKRNLVLDLRGNGGGALDVMQEIAGYLCKTTEKKPVVAVADYGERRERFRANFNVYNEYFSEDSRICVLADGETASASECLIGAMLDYGTITYGDVCLSGSEESAKTFGKGIMQTTFHLSWFERDAIKLTTAQIRWPITDTCIHDRGILASDGTKSVLKTYEGDTELINAIAELF